MVAAEESGEFCIGRGVDFKGGGSTPFASPFTLRFKGGSNVLSFLRDFDACSAAPDKSLES